MAKRTDPLLKLITANLPNMHIFFFSANLLNRTVRSVSVTPAV